jgi:protein N-terminal glutamine amidohydrolase
VTAPESPADPRFYCPFYCEENVWQLCGHPRVAAAERWVLFISNPVRRVAMWGQRAAPARDRPIAWDYHVVLLVRASGSTPGPWQIWDPDALEPELQPASAWLARSFDRIGMLPPIYTPRFRMIACADYRRHLRSDRRHMLDPDGRPRQTPPPWPVILGEPVPSHPDDGNNLDHFIDTEDPRFLGRILELDQLRQLIG